MRMQMAGLAGLLCLGLAVGAPAQDTVKKAQEKTETVWVMTYTRGAG